MISKLYKQREIIDEMETFVEQEGFIQLNDFLDIDLVKIREKILNSKLIEVHEPLTMRRKELNLKEVFDVELLKLIEYFKNKEFLEFVEEISDTELNLKDLKVCVYEHRDFIILNDKTKREDCLEVVFDISDIFNREMGGILTYLTKMEEVFYLEPAFNSMTMLFKSEEIMKYLKYINNKSENRKIVRFEISFDFSD